MYLLHPSALTSKSFETKWINLWLFIICFDISLLQIFLNDEICLYNVNCDFVLHVGFYSFNFSAFKIQVLCVIWYNF